MGIPPFWTSSSCIIIIRVPAIYGVLRVGRSVRLLDERPAESVIYAFYIRDQSGDRKAQSVNASTIL